MQIKVSNTRMHEITKRVDLKEKGASVPYQQQVHVAEAKLVLIPYGQTIDDKDILITQLWFVRQSIGRHYYPILISETEEIQTGDWVYPNKGRGIFTIQIQPNTIKSNYSKVLALPEHFSPKHLQAIADGKIKDGDCVLVECENKETVEDGGGCYVAGNMEIIKLNESNHITLHPAEVKMYTEDDMRKAAFTAVLAYGDEWRMPNKKDFNQFFDLYIQKKIK